VLPLVARATATASGCAAGEAGAEPAHPLFALATWRLLACTAPATVFAGGCAMIFGFGLVAIYLTPSLRDSRSTSAALTSLSGQINQEGFRRTISSPTSSTWPIRSAVPKPLGRPVFAPGESGA
jgi:hypothetical protein